MAPTAIHNVNTNIKRQSSIITIPEWGMPWLATGARRRGGRIGWLGRVEKLPRALLRQNQFAFAGAAQGITFTVMADKQFFGIGEQLFAVHFALLVSTRMGRGGFTLACGPLLPPCRVFSHYKIQ